MLGISTQERMNKTLLFAELALGQNPRISNPCIFIEVKFLLSPLIKKIQSFSKALRVSLLSGDLLTRF